MQLKLLWNLQETDVSIHNIEEDIEQAPLKSGVQEKKETLEKLQAEKAEKEAKLKADQKTLRELEMKTLKIVDDRKELYDNMYGGKGGNVKELEQKQRRMDQLAAEKKNLEDNVIVLMESIEEQEEQLKTLTEELRQAEDDLKKTEVKLATELEELKEKLSGLVERRQERAGKIDSKLLEKYRILAEKHQGRPLARVDNDICGGCRVFISGALRGHLYNPDALVYCENCGRLLVIIED
jgi:uncharacterized protein